MRKLMKTLSVLMSVCCMACAALQPANAAAAVKSGNLSVTGDNIIAQEILEAEDGGHLVITTKDTTPADSGITPYSTTYTKSAAKVYDYRNANNVLCWTFTLNATFKYDKAALVVCTDVSSSADIYKSNWDVVSKTHSKKANQATGKAVFNSPANLHYTAPLTITCDKMGNIS